MFDHNLFQDNLVGVDFCERMVRETNPSVLRRAETTAAPHAAVHGYRTIADIMRALNPFEGEFYREALHMSRVSREMYCLIGRPPRASLHALPGRHRDRRPTCSSSREYLMRLMRYVDFVKRVVPLHDDLFDFFYEALPGYEEVGRRRVMLACWGSFQDPTACDFDYRTMGQWGRAMFVTPGVVVDGELRHHRPGRHQPRYPHPARAARSTTTGRTRRSSSPRTRSATPSISAIRGTRPRSRARRGATSRGATPG